MCINIPVVPEPGIIIILFLRDNQYNQDTMEYWIYDQDTMEYWIYNQDTVEYWI